MSLLPTLANNWVLPAAGWKRTINTWPRLGWLDVTYWLLFTPFVTGMLTRLTTIGLLAMAVTRPTLSLEIWIELPLALVLADIAGCWSHRLRHRGVFWHFHAIHHSPTKLDALSAHG